MTRFWWVRHGPTHAKGFVGWADVPADLSDTSALARLDKHLPKDALVISSDLQRSVATADAICGSRERLDHNRDLREMNFGDWDQKTFTEVAAMHPELSRMFWTDPGDCAPPNGESWHQTADRVAGAVETLANLYSGRDIVVVAHIGVILTQVQRASNMSPAAAMSFVIDNLSVTQIEHLGDAWRIIGVNHKP